MNLLNMNPLRMNLPKSLQFQEKLYKGNRYNLCCQHKWNLQIWSSPRLSIRSGICRKWSLKEKGKETCFTPNSNSRIKYRKKKASLTTAGNLIQENFKKICSRSRWMKRQKPRSLKELNMGPRTLRAQALLTSKKPSTIRNRNT